MNIVIATIPANVPNPNIYVATNAIIKVGNVLVILKASLTKFKTNFDLFILTDDNIAKGIFNSSTVMYTAAQLAAYMGFSEIYLIGVDHHFHISRNNKGEIVVDNTVKDYFSDRYNEDKEKLYIPNTEQSTLTYYSMKDHCERRNIQVFNATRGGKLEVLDRVDFESLFE